VVLVRTLAEEEEYRINHQYDVDFGEQVIGNDYPESNHQDLVGDKHLMSFLKELSQTKHDGEQVTGYNDQILAKGAPKHVKETPGKQVEVKTKFTNLFDKTTKVDPIKGVK
jgi:hypothetical protein